METKSKIGIGSVQFGLNYGIANKNGQTDSIEVTQILNYARVNNIDVIDTASVYGSSEEVLGRNNLAEFKIISKFLTPSADSISSQLYSSISKLNVESIYGYLAHRPLAVLQNRNQWIELVELKTMGLIKKVGFSLNSPFELQELLQSGLYPDLIQVPYNYFDKRFKPLLIELKKGGCEIHTRSVFLQGLFFADPAELPEYFDEVKHGLIQLQQTVKDLPKALLNYVIHQPFIDKVIVGVETLSQLKENYEDCELATKLTDGLESFSDRILMPSNWPVNDR
jgi:aryl-alcohol dehydrogenase-like predicted oxidoreductase